MSRELIFGRNSVEEALNSGVSLSKIWLAQNSAGKFQQLETEARKLKIPVLKVDSRELERIIGKQERSYNIAAELAATKLYELSELKDSKYKQILFAVNIEDPHNLGALIRSARAFNFDAVIIPSRNAATMSPVVIAASAGAALSMPIIRVNNAQTAIEKLKQMGFWIYATSVRSDKTEDYRSVKYDTKPVILMGNEHKGLGPAVMQHADFTIHIPCQFESLNVSVAAGVILAEVYRQNG